MRKDCKIASNEWYLPKDWKQSDIDEIIEEKKSATIEAHLLFDELCTLEDKIEKSEYQKLWVKFYNLKFVTKIWYELTLVLINYVKYFETKDDKYESMLFENLENLLKYRNEAVEILGDDFYCLRGDFADNDDRIPLFVQETKQSFEKEKIITEGKQNNKSIIDFVVCGGVMEGHELQKEVNFSDTLLLENSICRIPGNRNGLQWSSINAHGWFSYKLKVTLGIDNVISICAGAASGNLNMKVTIGNQEHIVSTGSSEITELQFIYKAESEEDFVRIRFDKISADMPCVYTIDVTR